MDASVHVRELDDICSALVLRMDARLGRFGATKEGVPWNRPNLDTGTFTLKGMQAISKD